MSEVTTNANITGYTKFVVNGTNMPDQFRMEQQPAPLRQSVTETFGGIVRQKAAAFSDDGRLSWSCNNCTAEEAQVIRTNCYATATLDTITVSGGNLNSALTVFVVAFDMVKPTRGYMFNLSGTFRVVGTQPDVKDYCAS